MADDPLVPADFLPRAFCSRPGIWQLGLRSPDQFAVLSKNVGSRLLTWPSEVVLLWQTGLLLADLVIAAGPSDTPGLVLIDERRDGERWYADHRAPALTVRGVLDCAKNLGDAPAGATPFFHTFRVHIVHHLDRLLAIGDHIGRLVPLADVAAYASIVDQVIASLEHVSLGDSFFPRMRRWEDLTRLAIVSEPQTCERILGRLRVPPEDISEEEGERNPPPEIASEKQRKRIRAHAAAVEPLFRRAGLERIEAARHELCRAAQLIEPNKDLLNVARLGLRQTRLDLPGHFGMAMHLRVMAEAIRRVAEEVFETELPEEDECGLGWPEGIREFKRAVYGGHRILDDDSAARAFLKQQGLVRGLEVRWYVEGETEFGFVDHVLGLVGRAGIELVNLRGQVA
jgi:hypothetical protein